MLLAVAAVVVSHHLPTEVERYIRAELDRRFPHLDYEISGTDLVEHRGIIVRELVLYTRATSENPREKIASIEELVIECPLSLTEFLEFYEFSKNSFAQCFVPRKITLIKPTIFVSRRTDGSLPSWEQWKSAVPSQGKFPTEIQQAAIVYHDALTQKTLEIGGINATIAPPEVGEKTWNFTAEIANSFLRHANCTGSFDTESGDWDMRGEVAHCSLNSEWLAPLLVLGEELEHENFSTAEKLQTLFSQPQREDVNEVINSLRGEVSFSFQVLRDVDSPLGTRFSAAGKVDHAQVFVPSLRQKLTAIATSFHLTDETFSLTETSALLDRARITRCEYRQNGLTQIEAATLETDWENLFLDDSMIRAAVAAHSTTSTSNQALQTFLEKCAFNFTANTKSSLIYRDGKWKPDQVSLQVEQASFQHSVVPYRIDHLNGWITLTENELKFILSTNANEPTPIQAEGHLTGIASQPAGKIKISGQHLAVNQRLIETLPPKPRQVVASLNPRGHISVMLLLEIAAQKPLKKYMEIGLERCSIVYDKFPYPLNNLDGFLVMQDDRWTFNNIIGQHETTTVRGFGHIIPRKKNIVEEAKNIAADATISSSFPKPHSLNESATFSANRAAQEETDYEFFLSVNAVNLPLDGDLPKAILNPKQRDILNGVRAKGKVTLDAQISYIPSLHNLGLRFTATPLPGMSICPVHFPYPIHDVEGTITYVDGRVKVDQFRGRNKETRVASNLECRFGTQGDWSLSIDDLTVDRLPPNRELANALPSQLLAIYDSLRVQGAVNLKGWLGFSQSMRQDVPLRTEWDLDFILHNNLADLGLPTKNIFGKVSAYGRNEAGLLRCGGSLWLDQAVVLDMPLTDITGPFYYSSASNLLTLGTTDKIHQRLRREQLCPPSAVLPPEFGGGGQFDTSNQPTDWTTSLPLGAKLCDGNLRLNGNVFIQQTFQYNVALEGSGVDLNKFAHLFTPPTQRLEGKIACRANVHGEGRRMETLGGKGRLWLTEADVYELPAMMRMFQVLRLGNAERGAFSAGEIDFNLQGSRAILEAVYFEGNALSLRGSGDYNIETRHVDLLMGTRFGNRSSEVPLVSDFLGRAGDQLTQLRVVGQLGNTTVQRVTLPDIRQAINSRDESPRHENLVIAPSDASYYIPPQAEAPPKPLRDRMMFWK